MGRQWMLAHFTQAGFSSLVDLPRRLVGGVWLRCGLAVAGRTAGDLRRFLPLLRFQPSAGFSRSADMCLHLLCLIKRGRDHASKHLKGGGVG